MISLLALTFMKTPPPRARRCSPVSRMQFLTHSSSTASVNFCTPPAIASKDRKSTRLNSSHSQISDAAFCLQKKGLPRRVVLGPAAGGEEPEAGPDPATRQGWLPHVVYGVRALHAPPRVRGPVSVRYGGAAR